jgi:alkylated DNA repair dioxygenase AlkB
MNLFESNPSQNLLPLDGAVFYLPALFSESQSHDFFQILLNTIPWRQDEVFIFGKKHITARKMAWFADDGISYTYSKSTKAALAWTVELLEIKKAVEQKTGEKFNACLLNLYADGTQGMGWHSDDEKSIEQNSTIASVSLGVKRKFSFKHRSSKQKVEVFLENGSLLLMQGETQKHWLHSLPKSLKLTSPRINLTFRKMLI